MSIILPTLNPGTNATTLHKALAYQRMRPGEVVIVDSASTDGSPEYWRSADFRVFPIRRIDFDHGGTRNLGARNSRGTVLVFMTQDAIPADEHWLSNLVSPIWSGEAVATYARQVPRNNAGTLERFARGFNYPARSRVRELADVDELGYKAFFFSNVCSAVRTDVFWEVGGFPEGVILNEDVLLCAKLLRAGHRVKYEADARVYHSHDYGLIQQFRRNFDIGASISQAGTLLRGARTGGEGFRFVSGQARYVCETGDYLRLPEVFAEAAFKLAGFALGARQRYIPRVVKRRLSMHAYYWDRKL